MCDACTQAVNAQQLLIQLEPMQANILPGLVFNADTSRFCKPVFWPELALTCIYSAFATATCLTGLALYDKLDYFGFYEAS